MRDLSVSEIRQFLAAISLRSAFGPRDRAMFILDLHTGLRVSEICGLVVGDVSRFGQPREALDLLAGKGGKSRVIPLNSSARASVATILEFNQRRGFLRGAGSAAAG